MYDNVLYRIKLSYIYHEGNGLHGLHYVEVERVTDRSLEASSAKNKIKSSSQFSSPSGIHGLSGNM